VQSKPEQIISTANLDGIRTLIVDDNETNRKILLHQVASWGMIGIEADSGARALKLLRESSQKEPFQIAILDLMMPEMDGFELARTIKSDPAISQVHLILLPSFGKRGDGKTAREAGIAAYLQKPVRQSQLYNCLVSVILEQPVNNNVPDSKRLLTRHSKTKETVLTEKAAEVPVSELRILVAEDNIINQKVALSQLRSLGYAATAVANGREAVKALKNYNYDIVLMDCQMPEMDGFEATAEIRRNEGDSNRTVIIAMTANALEGEREACVAAGMDDYLSKPVKIESLRLMLERWAVSTNDQLEPPAENPNISAQNVKESVIDLSVLESFREFQQPGETDLVTELINLFINDGKGRLSILKKALAEKDIKAIKREAHSLTGGAGNIGARQMTLLSRELEQKADQITEAEPLIRQLENEFEQAVNCLEAIIKENSQRQ
jgi:CheY-like chemotaxis protein